MRKFLADLFAGRLSLEFTLGLGISSVAGILFSFGCSITGCGVLSATTVGPILLLVLYVLSSLGCWLMPIAIWNCAIKSPRDKLAEEIAAMGCALGVFMIGLTSLFPLYALLKYLWGMLSSWLS